MKKAGIALDPNWRLDKNGKLVKRQKRLSVSKRIQQRTSKKVRVAR